MGSKAGKRFTLYTQGTPNGHKASIALEEVGAEYETVAVDFSKNEQKADWFVKINPNGRIPALVDHEAGDQRVFETGSILLYLAERFPDSNLLPKDPGQKADVISWLMWQMGGLGPMQGQSNHFIRYAPVKIAYGMKRYNDETKRLFGVLEAELADGREWLVGSHITLADIASFPWVAIGEWSGVDTAAYPHLFKWLRRVGARPAVARGLAVPKPASATLFLEDEAKRKEELAHSQEQLRAAGAAEAASGENAAFSYAKNNART